MSISRFCLRTAVRISSVKVSELCRQADVEGLCAADSRCLSFVPCTLYFALKTPEQVARFESLQAGLAVDSFHWLDATEFMAFNPDELYMLFLRFMIEPVTVEEAAWLEAKFAEADIYDLGGKKI